MKAFYINVIGNIYYNLFKNILDINNTVWAVVSLQVFNVCIKVLESQVLNIYSKCSNSKCTYKQATSEKGSK